MLSRWYQTLLAPLVSLLASLSLLSGTISKIWPLLSSTISNDSKNPIVLCIKCVSVFTIELLKIAVLTKRPCQRSSLEIMKSLINTSYAQYFGSMYDISSSMKIFFGSMYEISSYYDRDFLIHEIFISWRFHDPYNAEDNFLSDHLRHQASSTPEWPRNELPIRTSYWKSESLAKQFPRAHIVDRSRQTGR